MLDDEDMERGRQAGQEFRLQKFVQSLRSAGWLGKLLRHTRDDEGEGAVNWNVGGGASGEASQEPAENRSAPEPANQTTQEFAAQLPRDVTDSLEMGDPSISPPIYPPADGVGTVREYPDPVHYGRDWRLLLPHDSETYQEAIKNPLPEDDPQYAQVLRMLARGIPKRN